MQLNVIDTKGNASGKISLPDEMFAKKPNYILMAQAVRVYLANKRQGTAKVKSRGEITGSTRKIYRQKGTGRARHGDRYAPIFVGGGVAHGPRGDQNVKLKLSKKMRRNALFSALSQKVSDKQLVVVQGLEKLEPKTKIMKQTLDILKKKVKSEEPKASIIVTKDSTMIKRSAQNLNNVDLISAKKMNTYEVMNAGFMVVMKDAINTMKETFLINIKDKKELVAGLKKSKIGKTNSPKKTTKSTARKEK